MAALALLTSVMPMSSAQPVGLTVEAMRAEIEALDQQFRLNSPDFWRTLNAAGFDLPVEAYAMPVLSVPDAQQWTRNMVIQGTPAKDYADFVVALYKFYKERGALGIQALKGLSGEDIAKMVSAGILPSHSAYQKFNLLGFYASLRDPSNERWLLEQQKTNDRAQQRVKEVVAAVTPKMREDAGRVLGEAMAIAYADILALQPVIGGVGTDSHNIPLPPTPPLPVPAPGAAEVREKVGATEAAAIAQAKYVLQQVVPLVTDVKLTALNELTLVMEQLTSLTQVFRTLETYYYEYNYYYHYQFLQQFWYLYDYRVDHIEKVDRVQYRLFVEDTYKLMQYLYNYNDLINVKGLISGVLALDYAKVVPAQVPALPTNAALDEVRHTPEVQVLLDFVMPFTFDIVDELNLYFVQELVNKVLSYFKTEYHYYWEYHIRNYWRWDPEGEGLFPFADAALSTTNDYIVSVAEDLSLGKVLNVIPISTIYREGSISVFAPVQEYPVLDKAAFLEPAPVSFLPNQVAAGATAQKLTEYLHIGPAPNALDVRAGAARLTDRLVAAGDAQVENLKEAYGSYMDLLGRSYGSLGALYELIPSEVRVRQPSLTVPAVSAPSGVDHGIDAYQVMSWDAAALPGFIPQFAFAGIRAVDGVDAGRPIVVNVNARGLGTPVSFVLDLNGAVVERAQLAATALTGAQVPAVPGVPSTGLGELVPAASGYTGYVETLAAWGTDLASWVRARL